MNGYNGRTYNWSVIMVINVDYKWSYLKIVKTYRQWDECYNGDSSETQRGAAFEASQLINIKR